MNSRKWTWGWVARHWVICALMGVGSVLGQDDAVGVRLHGMLPEAILRVQSSVTPSELRFGEANIAGYAILGEVEQLPTGAAEQILEVVQNPAGFGIETTTRCPFAPGISIRFVGNGVSADLLVCFGCDEVAVVPDGGAELGVLAAMPQATRDVLLGVAKASFPNDEGIQALPAVRRAPTAPGLE